MKRTALLLCLSVPLTVTAKTSKKDLDYQDAMLRSFQMVQQGSRCSTTSSTSGTVNANTDSSGQTNGTVNSSGSGYTVCQPNSAARYTLLVGGQVLVLTPAPGAGKVGAAMLTMGIAAAFWKNSALYGVLPNTPVKIRSDGGGTFHVKVGKRESAYRLVSAE